MVVGGQEQVDKQIVVARSGKVEVALHPALKVGLAFGAHKVHSIVHGAELYSLLSVVGVFQFIVAPGFTPQRIAVATGRCAGIVFIARIVPHVHFITPLACFVKQATHLARAACNRGVGCLILFEFELFTVQLLCHAVQAVIGAVHKHLYKVATGAGEGFFLLGSIVGAHREVVPQVGGHTVAHASTVYIHGVEYPVVVRAQAKKAVVKRVTIGIV